MVEISKERVEKILHDETPKDETLKTILRGIYLRYARLYEEYFADIDALNGQIIARLRQDHEEIRGLIKSYYLDIPHDVCLEIKEFDTECTDKLLGSDWHKYLLDNYAKFKAKSDMKNKNKELLKAEFSKQAMSGFYDAMDYIFRESFGTNSKISEKAIESFVGLLFGSEKD